MYTNIFLGYQHWELFHVFFCKKRTDPQKKCTSCCFIVMALIAFPFFSVAVAWFSWPHLIGTEVICFLLYYTNCSCY